MAKKEKAGEALANYLRELAMRKYPGTHLKSPWPGHLDLAVKDKTYAYLSPPGETFGISCKLPHSNAVALMMPNTEPTGYGLGKSGWVSAHYADDELPPAEIFEAWIDESYRAQAPKKLIAQLDAGGAAAAPVQSAPKKKSAAKKTAAKKASTRKPAAKSAAKKAAAKKTAAKKKR